MAITYTSNNVNSGTSAVVSIQSGTLTISTNDIIVAMAVTEDNAYTGTFSIANSGTAMSWTPIAITNTTGNCKVGTWWAKSAGNENRTVTVSWNGSSVCAMLSCRVHTGADTTNPVPTGNVFSGVGATSKSQAIVPTASGSALWMAVGDWSATNTLAAAANCTQEAFYHDAGVYDGAIERPTTNPRTDGNSFTIGETDTGGTIAWVAFEVQALAAAGGATFCEIVCEDCYCFFGWLTKGLKWLINGFMPHLYPAFRSH
ncbi:MAG: hypothetical protein ABSG91_24010 [Syntrophobacteraceae bacterium]|jgi:hypothetical protein